MTGWKIVISYYDGLWRPALCELEIPKDADIVGREPRVSFKPGSLFIKNLTTGETIQLSDDAVPDLTPVTGPVKCRCSKAKVIRLYKCKFTPFDLLKNIPLDTLAPLHGEGFSTYEIANEWNGVANLCPPQDMTAMASFLFNSTNTCYPTKYTPGNVITPHDFDPSPDNECAPGIHFFRECTEAIRYAGVHEVTSTSYPLRVCHMLNGIKVVPPKSNS